MATRFSRNSKIPINFKYSVLFRLTFNRTLLNQFVYFSYANTWTYFMLTRLCEYSLRFEMLVNIIFDIGAHKLSRIANYWKLRIFFKNLQILKKLSQIREYTLNANDSISISSIFVLFVCLFHIFLFPLFMSLVTFRWTN